MYSLQHPNIVLVYDYGQIDKTYFISMELIEGTDLRRYMRSRVVVDTENAVKIAYHVALGLGASHRCGVVHRSVIPKHILLSHHGSKKLSSFRMVSVNGMSREEDSSGGTPVNNVEYYAPEQAQGEIVTPTADIYSLGNAMYHMVTGHPPFDGDSPVAVAMQHIQNVPTPPGQFNPNIPTLPEEIIMRCLEKSPDRRFRDGSQLARALEALM